MYSYSGALSLNLYNLYSMGEVTTANTPNNLLERTTLRALTTLETSVHY